MCIYTNTCENIIVICRFITGLSSITTSTSLQNHDSAYTTTSPMYIIPNSSNLVSTANPVIASDGNFTNSDNNNDKTNNITITSTSLTSSTLTNRISSLATVDVPFGALHAHKRNGDLVAMSQLSETEIQKSHNLSAPSIGGDDTSLADNNLLEEIQKGSMYFGTQNATEVTSQRGTTAYLPCTIHFLHGEGMVSIFPCEQI